MNTLPAKGVVAEHFFSPLISVIFLLLSGCGGGSASPPSEPMPPAPPPPPSQVALTRLSSDSFTNSQSQHATEVEAGMSASGATLVTAFQVGRIYGGGAADIGFAISIDSGTSWTNGLLPGITKFQGGTYNAASDPTVAFDQSHGVWIIASLAIASGTDLVVVSRSADGHNWGNPIVVSSTSRCRQAMDYL